MQRAYTPGSCQWLFAAQEWLISADHLYQSTRRLVAIRGSYSQAKNDLAIKQCGSAVFTILLKNEGDYLEDFTLSIKNDYSKIKAVLSEKSVRVERQGNREVYVSVNVLEGARKSNTKFVFMSTCMVYNRAFDETGITEKHPTKPASPYSACKLSGEELVISYYHAYNLPTVVLRPFNTYGPFQKSSGEGGVVSIFIKKDLAGEYLNIYGDGAQTRDLLYVEDCAKFVIAAGESNKCNGLILNAGSGRDININDLAYLICKDKSRIKNIPHIHPQSEIAKLLCNNKKAMDILGWAPEVSLEEGIAKTREFIGIAQR